MRFVKGFAAMAAFVCSAAAGQAGAAMPVLGVATGTTTLDYAGMATVALPTSPCGRCRIVISAPLATSALPEFLYTYHVTPYRPSNFTPYDKTVAIPVGPDPTRPNGLFAYEPNGFGTATFMPARVIPGLGPVGERALATIVSFNSASIKFTGTPGAAVDYAVTVSAAPEPSTWALMIAGFGAIGAAMRQRRRANHAGGNWRRA